MRFLKVILGIIFFSLMLMIQTEFVSADNCGNIVYLGSNNGGSDEENIPSSNSPVKIKFVGICDDSVNDPKHTLEKTPDVRYHIHIEIKNEGDDEIKDAEIRYYISKDKVFGDSDDKYIASDFVDSIKPGETKTDRKTQDKKGDAIKTPDELGDYFIYAKVLTKDGGADKSNPDDRDEYANLTVKEYVPPPPPKTLRITDPVGGTWKTDRSHTINWETENVPGNTHVKIEYSLDSNNWYLLTDSTNNDGEKGWNMRDKPFKSIIKKDTDKAKIKIKVVEYPNASDISPRFRIDYKK